MISDGKKRGSRTGSPIGGPCILENQLHDQLNLTRGSGAHQIAHGTCALPEVRISGQTIGIGEVRMIQQVESLGSELHSVTLGDLAGLRKANIDLRKSRTSAGVANNVAVLSGWRSHEGSGVELVTGHAVIRRPNQIGRAHV